MGIKGKKALFLSGQEVFIEECNIVITPPTIKDIAIFGEDSFLIAAQLFGKTGLFTTAIKEGNPILSDFSDFQILMIMLSQQEDLLVSVNAFFELIFPKYTVRVDLDNQTINFIIEDMIVGQIQVFNFMPFQQYIEALFIPVNPGVEDEIEYNPAGEKAKKIAEQLKAGRRKVAQLQAAMAGDNDSLYGRYASILSIGLGMDLNMLYNYTPYQLCDSFNRYILKIKYDYYMKVSTTPLMDTSKLDEPEDWMGNI